jgi:alpha-glucosidase
MNKPISRRAVLRGAATALSAGAALAQDAPLELGRHPVEVTLTPVSRTTVRIMILGIENGQPQAIPADGALAREDWPSAAARIRNISGSRSVGCGGLVVKLTGAPFSIRVESKGGDLVQELKTGPDAASITLSMGSGPVLGLGQGGPQFDRRGNVDRMGNGQAAYKLATHGAKVPIQLLIGTSGWAMYIHQPLGTLDLTGKEGSLHAQDGLVLPLDVFVIGAKEPAEVMREYARITGFAEMPPLWSFGYQQSHRTLGPPEKIVEEARQFREKKLPCDAMIYLGTDFCPNGWNTHNGEFTWNDKAFPDPKKTIDDLHTANFKVVLHTVLEGHKLTGSAHDPCTAAPLPSGRTPDGHWPPDRQVSCYWPVHKPLLDLGIDGWWPDQGDGLDAPSRLARNRMYFEGHQLYRPNERVYALHRNAYAGMQRYASFLWSGDVQSTWETLKTHVPIGVNTGLSGIPYWGTDIGGFIPTKDFTGELYLRWFQFAAFNPLFRSHGRDWRLHLPWGWNTGEIGVPETENFHPPARELRDPLIEPICKKYLELRYRLMPYLYSAVKETCETGMPIIRSLWLHYPDDSAAVSRGDEYLYGRDILVAPVVEKGAVTRVLYLPRGSWYDFWTHEKLDGGREISRKVDLETTPLYVRAGALIPMGPVKQYTAERVEGPLEVVVHPGANGAFSLYEDDGATMNYRQGKFMRIDMHWDDRRRQLSLRLAKDSQMLPPTNRKFALRIAGEQKVRDLVFHGRPVTTTL